MQKIIYANMYGESIEFDSSGGALTLEEIDANSLGTTVATSKNAGQDGQTTTGITYNAKDIRCKLGIKGMQNGRWSRAEYDALWRQLTETILPHQFGLLTYINDSGSYQIECYPQEITQPEHKSGEYYTLTLDFIADWPFWQSDFEQQISILPGQSAAINNPSGIDMPLTIIITGIASNVKLLNETTGEFLRMAQSLADGAKLTVDTKKFKARLDDGTLANYKLASNSTYLRIPHGTSKLSLTSNGVQPIKIKYRQIYLGV